MKKFEYVYFTIYHFNSRQSYFHDSLYVRLKSMYLLSLSAGGWILLMQMLFLRFIRNVWFTSHPGAMFYALAVYTIITAVFHRVFIIQEQDQKIFNKFVGTWDNNPNKQRDLFIAFFVATVPYIAMLCIRVFFPR